MEVIEQLESLKENLQPLKERDSDIRNCVKQLRRAAMSYTAIDNSMVNLSGDAGSPDTSMVATSATSSMIGSSLTTPGSGTFMDKINTCSYTLESLMSQLRVSIENEEA